MVSIEGRNVDVSALVENLQKGSVSRVELETTGLKYKNNLNRLIKNVCYFNAWRTKKKKKRHKYAKTKKNLKKTWNV